MGAVSFAQTQTSIPSMPTWALYLDHHVTIDIPLGEEGRPFRIEGRIVDSRNVVARGVHGIRREQIVSLH
jgi:hypothetical protein